MAAFCFARSRLFELARVLVLLDHVTRCIVNADHNIMWKGEYSCRKRRKALSIKGGHISQIVGRSSFDSPPDRHFGKTSRFTSRHSFIAFSVQDRRKRDVSHYESKTLRRSKSTMGKAKTQWRQQSSAKERRTHTSGTKETFPTDESSVGSNKKSRRQKITYGLCPMSGLSAGRRLPESQESRLELRLRISCGLQRTNDPRCGRASQ